MKILTKKKETELKSYASDLNMYFSQMQKGALPLGEFMKKIHRLILAVINEDTQKSMGLHVSDESFVRRNGDSHSNTTVVGNTTVVSALMMSLPHFLGRESLREISGKRDSIQKELDNTVETFQKMLGFGVQLNVEFIDTGQVRTSKQSTDLALALCAKYSREIIFQNFESQRSSFNPHNIGARLIVLIQLPIAALGDQFNKVYDLYRAKFDTYVNEISQSITKLEQQISKTGDLPATATKIEGYYKKIKTLEIALDTLKRDLDNTLKTTLASKEYLMTCRDIHNQIMDNGIMSFIGSEDFKKAKVDNPKLMEGKNLLLVHIGDGVTLAHENLLPSDNGKFDPLRKSINDKFKLFYKANNGNMVSSIFLKWFKEKLFKKMPNVPPQQTPPLPIPTAIDEDYYIAPLPHLEDAPMIMEETGEMPRYSYTDFTTGGYISGIDPVSLPRTELGVQEFLEERRRAQSRGFRIHTMDLGSNPLDD